MTKRLKAIIAPAATALVFIGLFWEFHLVRDSAQDTVLLWNGDEAYLFVGWGRSGYHFTGFEYLFSYIPAYFGVPRTVDDNRLSMLVFRITPAAVQRYVTEPYQMYRGFLAYIPRDKTIYAYDGGAMLWKWAGTDFETVTPEEQRTLVFDQNALTSNKDYTNMDGWSSRHSLAMWPPTSVIELQGKRVTLLTESKESGREVSIELQLPGKPPQTILRTKTAWHLISKSAYQRMFSRP